MTDYPEFTQPPAPDEPNEPPQVPGFITEWIKQLGGVAARHILLLIGGILVGKGWISQDWLNSFIDTHTAAIGSLLFTGVAFVWAGINSKRLLGMITGALHLHPQKLTGQAVTIADVRSAVKSGQVGGDLRPASRTRDPFDTNPPRSSF